MGDYIGEYDRGYEGRYQEFRLLAHVVIWTNVEYESSP